MSIVANSARAQAVNLHWSAPAECPSDAAMQERVATLLEGATSKVHELHVVAKVSGPRRSEYRIALQIDTGAHSARRVLHAASCSDLSEAAAWLIALAAAPALSPGNAQDSAARSPTAEATQAKREEANSAPTRARTEPSARSDAATKAPTSTADSEDRTAQPKNSASTDATAARAQLEPAATEAGRSSSPPWPRLFRAGAQVGIVTGDGAGVQAALGGFLGYGVGTFYTQARVHGSVPREVSVATTGRLRLWTLAAELSECALFGSVLRAGPCVGVSLLRGSAQLEGLTAARDRTLSWAAVGAGLQLFWPLPKRVELSLAAAARLPLSRRPRYVVEGLGTVVSAQVWSADVRLGVGFALP